MSGKTKPFAALMLSILLCSTLVASVAAQSAVWFNIIIPSVYARSEPAWTASRVASLFDGDVVHVIGKNADGTWLQVRVSGLAPSGWVYFTVGEIAGDFSTVPVVDSSTASTSTSTSQSTVTTQTAQQTTTSSVNRIWINISAPSTYARNGPGFTNTRVASLFQGESYLANGRNDLGTWLRLVVPGAGNLWISTFVVVAGSNFGLLPVASAEASTTTSPATTTSTPPTIAVPVAVAAPSTSLGGFELGGQVHGFGSDAVSAMRRAGMTWVKRQARWAPGTPASAHIGLIEEAHARGFKILLSVTGSSLDDAVPANFPDFAQLVAELAAAGADAIEVWNEQNLIRGDGESIILPATFANLMAHAYPAIKAANPGTIVISGAPAPTGFFGGCSTLGCDDNHFIAGFVAAGGLAYTDCLGIHYNEGILSPTLSSGDPRGASSHYTRYYQGMVDTYYALAGGQRPLCFTELGYLSGEDWGFIPAAYLWRPPYNLTLAEHALYLAEATSLSRSQGKVRLLIVFNVDLTFFGDDPKTGDPQAGYAIIRLRLGGECPACDTLGAVMGAG